MFVIDFNQFIVDIGFVQIRWYSLIYALGFILAYFWYRQVAKKKLVSGFDKGKVDDLVVYMIVFIVVFARLFYFIFYDIGNLVSLELFKIWHGGVSFHGGLIGGVLALWWFSKRKKIGFWKIMDITSVAVIFALMLGRIGNLINGELAGTEFNGAWCTVFPNHDLVCRHPYPVYAFISHLVLLGYLCYLIYLHKDKLKEFFGSKMLTINFLIGYGLLRIITDIWKLDNIVLGIKTGQLLSIFMVIIGGVIYGMSKRKKSEKV